MNFNLFLGSSLFLGKLPDHSLFTSNPQLSP